jgi:hypothetical protein
VAQGSILGIVDVPLCAGAMALAGDEVTGRFGSVMAFMMTWWFLLRAVLGMASAMVVYEDVGLVAAVRESARALRGFRLAAMASRLPILLFALVQTGLNEGASAGDEMLLVALGAVWIAITTTFDGLVESAWYRRLRPLTDQEQLARVFE